MGLPYRGYDIEDIAESATRGNRVARPARELPNRRSSGLPSHEGLRGLRRGCCASARAAPGHAHPMDVLRTGCLRARLETPKARRMRPTRARDVAIAARLVPGMLSTGITFRERDAHRSDGRRLRVAGTSSTCCTASRRSASTPRAMDVSLILYTEHEFNASTFACRVVAGTGSDFYSGVSAGSVRCAVRCTAARTKPRWRDREAYSDCRRGGDAA